MPLAPLPIRTVETVRSALANVDCLDAEIALSGESIAVPPASDLIALRAIRISLVTRRTRSRLGAGWPVEARLFHRGDKPVHRRMAGGHAPPGRIGRRGAQQHFAAPFAGSGGSGKGRGRQKQSEDDMVRLGFGDHRTLLIKHTTSKL
ncbi:conserved hypothetical protein [Ricinus communis]|uniref:Uncharacterized protein n=1 Tax=Ricinus communis TaxID=3988 RepID=B9TNM8_RICCO|nr:conserved hypothetical protein [Ricinus communis]